jgi:3-methyladenine DNA glycosylase AlkD
MIVEAIKAQVKTIGSPARAAQSKKFFKVGPGQYG